jgi:hypothetical protein
MTGSRRTSRNGFPSSLVACCEVRFGRSFPLYRRVESERLGTTSDGECDSALRRSACLVAHAKEELIQRPIVAIEQRQVTWPAAWSTRTDELNRGTCRAVARRLAKAGLPRRSRRGGGVEYAIGPRGATATVPRRLPRRWRHRAGAGGEGAGCCRRRGHDDPARGPAVRRRVIDAGRTLRGW